MGKAQTADNTFGVFCDSSVPKLRQNVFQKKSPWVHLTPVDMRKVPRCRQSWPHSRRWQKIASKIEQIWNTSSWAKASVRAMKNLSHQKRKRELGRNKRQGHDGPRVCWKFSLASTNVFFFLVDISDGEEYQKNGDKGISGYSISWQAAVWNDRYHEEF